MVKQTILPMVGISIHAPLAGRDIKNCKISETVAISIHAPLAGRDRTTYLFF